MTPNEMGVEDSVLRLQKRAALGGAAPPRRFESTLLISAEAAHPGGATEMHEPEIGHGRHMQYLTRDLQAHQIMLGRRRLSLNTSMPSLRRGSRLHPSRASINS